MKDTKKPDHVSFGRMIIPLREGQNVIPGLRRDFEWQPWEINQPMRCVFCD